ncbi:MAG: hypothetical protein FK732_00105 [Asgard group archaeon]|nr:hypothetical protein [Asgard group archaeon]
MSVLTYNIIADGVIGGTVMLGFIWSVSIIFLIIIIIYVMRGLTKIRSFIINDDEIKISIPYRPEFKISWSEIKTIQIKKHGFGRTRIFEFVFTNNGASLSFRYKPGHDFRVRTNKKIYTALENWCERKGKDFTGYK